MFKIKDISSIGYKGILEPGDVNLCLEFDEKGKKYVANLLVHDGYDISLLKVKSDNRLIVRVGQEVKTMDFEDLVKSLIYIYPISLTQFVLLNPDMYKLADKSTGVDSSVVAVALPEEILKIAIKVGYKREDFVNYVLYPILSKAIKNINEFSFESVTSSLINYFYSTLTSGAGYSEICYQMVSALFNDLVYNALTLAENDTVFSKKVTLSFDDEVVKSIYSALEDYTRTGDISSVTMLVSLLRKNKEKLGLFSLSMIDAIENKINNYSFGNTCRSLTEANKRFYNLHNDIINKINSVIEENSKKGLGEAMDIMREDGNMLPSQQYPVYATTPITENSYQAVLQSGRIPTLFEDVPGETRPLIKENLEDESILPLHKFYVDKYMNKYNELSSVTIFENPEEKEEMVKRLVRLLNDVTATKHAYSYGQDLEFSPKMNVGIYDVLANKITAQIDFVNNVKYYGTDPEIGELNVKNYISSENFSLLSIPINYFPGIVSAKGYGEVKIFGGDGGLVSNAVNNLRNATSRDIKDRDGNVIRNSRDKKYFRSWDDNNMTDKELAKFANRNARYMMYPGDGNNGNVKLFFSGAFLGAVSSLDTFFSGVQNLLFAILNTITLGIVSESYEPYKGSIVFSEAVINKARPKDFHNRTDTLGDKVDKVINVPINAAKGVVNGVSQAISGSSVLAGAREKVSNAISNTTNTVVEKTKETGSKVMSAVAGVTKNTIWIMSRIAFLFFIVRPIINLLKATAKGKVKNKVSVEVQEKKTYINEKCKSCYKMSDDLYNKIKDDKRFREKDVKRVKAIRDAFDEEDDIEETTASESFNINAVNKMNINKITEVKTLDDVDNLSKRIINTLKNANNNIEVKYIQYEDYNSQFWAIVGTNYGYVVLNLDNAYTNISREISPNVRDIKIGSTIIAVNAHTMSDDNVFSIIMSKQRSKPKKEENLQAKTEQDIKRSKVQEFEENILKKLEKKGMINNGRKEESNDRQK